MKTDHANEKFNDGERKCLGKTQIQISKFTVAVIEAQNVLNKSSGGCGGLKLQLFCTLSSWLHLSLTYK